MLDETAKDLEETRLHAQFNGGKAKSSITSPGKVQQNTILSRRLFLLFLQLLQLCQSLCPRPFPCHCSHFTLYLLNILLLFSLLQLSFPFLLLCLHKLKRQSTLKESKSSPKQEQSSKFSFVYSKTYAGKKLQGILSCIPV